MNTFSPSQYFNLYFELSKKEFSVRYKQALLGFAWAVIRPSMLIFAFYVVFGKVANLQPDNNLNYFTMVYLGMMPWFLFINVITDGGNSMLSNISMVTKVYFPRILLPLSVIFVSLVDFILMLSILIIFGKYFSIQYTVLLVLIPILILFIMVPAISIALILAPLSALFRDIKFIIPFLAQIGVYLTPVGFSSQIIKEKVGSLIYLNPMVLPIEAFRWIFSGVQTFDLNGALITIAVDILLLAVSIKIFFKYQSLVVDRI